MIIETNYKTFVGVFQIYFEQCYIILPIRHDFKIICTYIEKIC